MAETIFVQEKLNCDLDKLGSMRYEAHLFRDGPGHGKRWGAGLLVLGKGRDVKFGFSWKDHLGLEEILMNPRYLRQFVSELGVDGGSCSGSVLSFPDRNI